MVSCKQCTTHNSLDSAFCKKCGATLDAADLALANDRLTAMIADGNRLFADGRTDDALMVAETAVASNPSSPAAISLKGMCLERKGLLAEALECFESVVALQPDSTLDKLKVNDLKNLLVVEKFETNRAPDRRMALIGAMAAVMLVVAGGAIVARANSKPEVDNSQLLAMSTQKPGMQTFGDIMPKGNENNQASTQQQPQQPVQQPETQANPNSAFSENQQPPRNGGRENLYLPPHRGGSLPRPEEGFEGSIPPVRVEIPGGGLPNTNVKPPTNQTNTGVIDPQPGDMPPTTTDQGPKTTDDPKNTNAPGIIEIEVSKGNKPNGNSSGNNEPVSGNGRQALIATARSQMMSGNYSAAANTYERALRAGADQASTNQRLGQCYTQMGRNGDAVAAYTRAAGAFEKSGNSQGAEACRQAIKVLGG